MGKHPCGETLPDWKGKTPTPLCDLYRGHEGPHRWPCPYYAVCTKPAGHAGLCDWHNLPGYNRGERAKVCTLPTSHRGSCEWSDPCGTECMYPKGHDGCCNTRERLKL